jgi:hypothetical protein
MMTRRLDGAVLDDVAVRVEQVIQAQGSFRATTHMGVFTCRQAAASG